MSKTLITDINHTTHTVGSDTWLSESVSWDVHTSASAWSTPIGETTTTNTVHHAAVSAFSHVVGLSGSAIDHVIIVGASSHSAVHTSRRRCTTAKVMLLMLHVATAHGLITASTSSVAVVVWSLRSIALQGREGVSWFVWIEVDGSIFVEEPSQGLYSFNCITGVFKFTQT